MKPFNLSSYFRLIFFFAFLFVLTLFSGCNDDSAISNYFGEGDDYLIYSKVLLDIPNNNSLVVLSDYTQGELINQNNLKYYTDAIPGLAEETLQNYILMNQQKIRLKKISGSSCIFRSELDNSATKFVSVIVSRVGYNIDKSQAVVTVGVIWGPLAGSGYLLFFVKTGNEWQIQNRIMTWIS